MPASMPPSSWGEGEGGVRVSAASDAAVQLRGPPRSALGSNVGGTLGSPVEAKLTHSRQRPASCRSAGVRRKPPTSKTKGTSSRWKAPWAPTWSGRVREGEGTSAPWKALTTHRARPPSVAPRVLLG